MHHEHQIASENQTNPAQHADHHDHRHMVSDYRKRFWIATLLTIPVLILSPMIQNIFGVREYLAFQYDHYVLFGFSSLIFFYGGWPFLKGIYSELKEKKPGMMTLIALAITVAYLYSSVVVFGVVGKIFFWELATLIDIMLLGHWIEMRSVLGASRALEELVKLMPAEANLIMSDGSTKKVPTDSLKKGDHVLIKPGEKIPVDGQIIKGESDVNEAMLTGESKPVTKKIDDSVIGGSVNGEGSIQIEVSKIGNETFLSQVIQLVDEAQKTKSKTQDIANLAALYLTIIALSAGLITLLLWLFFSSKDFAFALERTVTVMVITCPHALGLAVPLVVAVSTSIAASRGLLIRNRAAFERARKIDAIIFDKTGTLTQGKFGVTDIINFENSYSENDLLEYAAAVESHSEHPIAQGIIKSAKNKFSVEKFKSITGKGAEGLVNGKNVKVISPGYLKERDIKFDEKQTQKQTSEGKTVIYVMIDNTLAGAIALADIIRPESKEAIKKLKAMGIQCMMLTGDNEQVAKYVAKEVGLDEYFAEVLPQDKVKKIKEVQQRGLLVAMTGDGVNDAPALAQADVGIAIGAGTDVAIETADIILVKSNPLDATAILSLARATTHKMIQNLIWATGYNAFAIPIAAGILYNFGILLSPAFGAVLMSLSTIIVAFNAKLLRIK